MYLLHSSSVLSIFITNFISRWSVAEEWPTKQNSRPRHSRR